MLLILLWLAQPLGGCWLKACSPAPALPGPLPRLALRGTWSSWRPPREGSWMRVMQPDTSGTEQRRGCASVCCQEGRMAAARGPGLRRRREPSHLDSPAPRRRWALGHTGRVQGPGPLGEPLRGEIETSVSCPDPESRALQASHQRPQCTGVKGRLHRPGPPAAPVGVGVLSPKRGRSWSEMAGERQPQQKSAAVVGCLRPPLRMLNVPVTGAESS